jgi:protein-disulfide isomerase
MRPLLPFAVAALLASPAAADLIEMTDAEREAFRAEVREYLLANPEVLMEAIGILDQRQADAQLATDRELVAEHADALFEDGVSWVGGNPDGDLTMVEFLDYRCGYCRRAHPEVTDLIAADGGIRYIVKEFPILGEQSVLASRFAIATRNVAGAEAYGTVHDALMTMRAEVSEPALEALAQELDLDAGAIFAAMEAPEVEAEIAANRALAEKMGISGTPTFVVGDEMLRGYLPLDQLMQVVEEARGEG